MSLQECKVEVEGEEVRPLEENYAKNVQTPKQERIKREQIERRRPPKRESRISILHIQHLEEDYLFDKHDAQFITTVKENQ